MHGVGTILDFRRFLSRHFDTGKINFEKYYFQMFLKRKLKVFDRIFTPKISLRIVFSMKDLNPKKGLQVPKLRWNTLEFVLFFTQYLFLHKEFSNYFVESTSNHIWVFSVQIFKERLLYLFLFAGLLTASNAGKGASKEKYFRSTILLLRQLEVNRSIKLLSC